MVKNVISASLLLFLLGLHVLLSNIFEISEKFIMIFLFFASLFLYIVHTVVFVKIGFMRPKIEIVEKNVSTEFLTFVLVVFNILFSIFHFHKYGYIFLIIYLFMYYVIIWNLFVKNIYFEADDIIIFVDGKKINDYRLSMIDIAGMKTMEQSSISSIAIDSKHNGTTVSSEKVTIEMKIKNWDELKEEKRIDLEYFQKQTSNATMRLLKNRNMSEESIELFEGGPSTVANIFCY